MWSFSVAVLLCFSAPTILKGSGSLVTTHCFSLAPCYFQRNSRVSVIQNTLALSSEHNETLNNY